ncbi:hypothetical protein Trydic_g16024 [Trypoxylus dichotomus]
MTFINGKVAIVTGGCSGIGLAITKALIQNKAKGITIADVNPSGDAIASELSNEVTRVLFVKVDVSIKEEFDNAFAATIKTFQHVDILINNAGILNDFTWEREIAINLNGTVYGCLLALHEYMPKYKTANEGAIINLSSTAGLASYPNVPVYTATKHAILGLTRSWGHEKHFAENNVRVMAICPNATGTPLLDAMPGRNLGPRYEKFFQEAMSSGEVKIQSTESVAECIVHMLNSGKTGSTWLVEDGKFCELNLPDIESMK